MFGTELKYTKHTNSSTWWFYATIWPCIMSWPHFNPPPDHVLC